MHNRRILALCVLLALSLCGCAAGAKEAAPGVEAGKNGGEVFYEEGVWPEKHWEGMGLPVQGDCVPDGDAALKLAEVLMESEQKQGRFPGYVPLSVFLDTEDRIFIVTFAESREHPGVCVSFAISKETAEVLHIWVGE